MKRILPLALASTLAACGLIDDRVETIEMERPDPGTERLSGGWRCVANEEGRWVCEGAEAEVASGQLEQPDSTTDLDGGVEAASAMSTETPAAENVTMEAGEKPLAEPRADDEVVVDDAATIAPVIATEADQAQDVASVQPVSDAQGGYVLQIGSYRQRGAAEAYLADADISGAEILRTAGEQGDWYVVLVGQYADFAAAKASGDALRDAHVGLDYWIRRKSDLEVLEN